MFEGKSLKDVDADCADSGADMAMREDFVGKALDTDGRTMDRRACLRDDNHAVDSVNPYRGDATLVSLARLLSLYPRLCALALRLRASRLFHRRGNDPAQQSIPQRCPVVQYWILSL